MKTSIQTLLTAFVVVVILASSATTFTSCAKKEDPAPTTTTTSTLTFPGINTYTTIILGDQNNALGGYYSTSLNATATGSTFNSNPTPYDFNFCSLPVTGSGALAQNPTLLSPSERAANGFTANIPTNANVTYITAYTGSKTFASATSGTIDSLAIPSTKSVTLASNGLYTFKTQAGKKGLVSVTNLNFTAGSGVNSNTVTISVKVQQ